MDINPDKHANRILHELFPKMRNEVEQDFANNLGRRMLVCSHFYWSTKDGRKMFIADMSDAHLANCMIALERQNSYNPFIAYELARRAHFKK